MWKKKDVVYEKDMDMDLNVSGPADDFDLGLDQPPGQNAPVRDDYPVFETRVFNQDPELGDGPRLDEQPKSKVGKQGPQTQQVATKPRAPAPVPDTARIDQLEKRIKHLELKVDHVIKLLRYIAATYKK